MGSEPIVIRFHAAARQGSRQTCSACQQQGARAVTHRIRAGHNQYLTVSAPPKKLLNCSLTTSNSERCWRVLKKCQNWIKRLVSVSSHPPQKWSSPEICQNTNRDGLTRDWRENASPYLARFCDPAPIAID